MKTFTAPVLATMMVFVSIAALPMPVHGEPAVGIKKGDWIEYAISMTGPPLAPLRNLTWYRTEILEFDGTSFKANKTALTVNGTFSSSIWNFNLAEGQTYGWVIIPANLSTGDAFFDVAKASNVTIEGEEQKTLLGASRTVTHASDPGRVYREWDKASGVYVYSVVNTDDYTVVSNAIATNMWSPEIVGQNQMSTFQLVIAILVSAALTSFLAIFIARRRRPRNDGQRFLDKKRFRRLMLRLGDEK